MREWLEQLEAELDDPVGAYAALAFLAAQSVQLDEEELRGPRRRALLLLARGGDPQRELDLDGRAVTALAADLDEPGRRARLDAALGALRAEAEGLPAVARALDELRADPERAWRWLACALLAEELAGD